MTIADLIDKHWVDITLLAITIVIFWGFKK